MTLSLLNLLVAAIVLAVLVWRVDVIGAVRNLPEFQWRWAAAGTLTFTASKIVHALRWKFFLRTHPELPFRQLLELFLASNLANAVIPLRAGDILRVELPNRRYGVPRGELASGVFVVESLLDGISFVVLALASLLIFDLPSSLRPIVMTLAVLVAAVGLLVVHSSRRQGWSLDQSAWRLLVPDRARARVGRWLDDALEGMRTLSTWYGAVVALVISLAAWILEVEVWWLMGRAFNIELAFSEALIVMIAANLAGAIPLTPWNIGPYEVVVTEALVLFGYSRFDASSYAIGSRLLLILWIGLTGVLAMWSLGLGVFGLGRRRVGSETTVAAKQEGADDP